MNSQIENKLLKISKEVVEYRDFYTKNSYFNLDWKIELQKNSLKKTQIGVLINNFNIEKIMKKIDDNSSEEKIFSLLKKEYQPKNKFNIGDKVDFVNDYGVIFKDHTITNFTLYEFGGYLYDTDKNDTSWFWKREKNLHLAGTYIEPVLDLELNNGLVAKFSHFDDWDNKVFTIELEPNSVNVVLVDGVLHSISDYDEPLGILKKEHQPK